MQMLQFFQKLDTHIMEGSSPIVSLPFGANRVFDNFHSTPFYLTFSTLTLKLVHRCLAYPSCLGIL